MARNLESGDIEPDTVDTRSEYAPIIEGTAAADADRATWNTGYETLLKQMGAIQGKADVYKNASPLSADTHMQNIAKSLAKDYGITSIGDIGVRQIEIYNPGYEGNDQVTGYAPYTEIQNQYFNKNDPTKIIPGNKFASENRGDGYSEYNLQPIQQADGSTIAVPVQQYSKSGWGAFAQDLGPIIPIINLALMAHGVPPLYVAAGNVAFQAGAGNIKDIGDVLRTAGPIMAGDPGIVGGVAKLYTAYQAFDQGNVVSGLATLASAGGMNETANGLRFIDAVKTGNVPGALMTLGQMQGVGDYQFKGADGKPLVGSDGKPVTLSTFKVGGENGFTLPELSKAATIATTLMSDNPDYGLALQLSGELKNSPDTVMAGRAASLVQQLSSPNPNPIALYNAALGLAQTTNAKAPGSAPIENRSANAAVRVASGNTGNAEANRIMEGFKTVGQNVPNINEGLTVADLGTRISDAGGNTAVTNTSGKPKIPSIDLAVSKGGVQSGSGSNIQTGYGGIVTTGAPADRLERLNTLVDQGLNRSWASQQDAPPGTPEPLGGWTIEAYELADQFAKSNYLLPEGWRFLEPADESSSTPFTTVGIDGVRYAVTKPGLEADTSIPQSTARLPRGFPTDSTNLTGGENNSLRVADIVGNNPLTTSGAKTGAPAGASTGTPQLTAEQVATFNFANANGLLTGDLGTKAGSKADSKADSKVDNKGEITSQLTPPQIAALTTVANNNGLLISDLLGPPLPTPGTTGGTTGGTMDGTTLRGITTTLDGTTGGTKDGTTGGTTGGTKDGTTGGTKDGTTGGTKDGTTGGTKDGTTTRPRNTSTVGETLARNALKNAGKNTAGLNLKQLGDELAKIDPSTVFTVVVDTPYSPPSTFTTDNITTPSSRQITTLLTDNITTLPTDKITTLATDKITTLATDKITTLPTDKITTLPTDKITTLSSRQITTLLTDPPAITTIEPRGLQALPTSEARYWRQTGATGTGGQGGVKFFDWYNTPENRTMAPATMATANIPAVTSQQATSIAAPRPKQYYNAQINQYYTDSTGTWQPPAGWVQTNLKGGGKVENFSSGGTTSSRNTSTVSSKLARDFLRNAGVNPTGLSLKQLEVELARLNPTEVYTVVGTTNIPIGTEADIEATQEILRKALSGFVDNRSSPDIRLRPDEVATVLRGYGVDPYGLTSQEMLQALHKVVGVGNSYGFSSINGEDLLSYFDEVENRNIGTATFRETRKPYTGPTSHASSQTTTTTTQPATTTTPARTTTPAAGLQTLSTSNARTIFPTQNISAIATTQVPAITTAQISALTTASTPALTTTPAPAVATTQAPAATVPAAKQYFNQSTNRYYTDPTGTWQPPAGWTQTGLKGGGEVETKHFYGGGYSDFDSPIELRGIGYDGGSMPDEDVYSYLRSLPADNSWASSLDDYSFNFDLGDLTYGFDEAEAARIAAEADAENVNNIRWDRGDFGDPEDPRNENYGNEGRAYSGRNAIDPVTGSPVNAITGSPTRSSSASNAFKKIADAAKKNPDLMKMLLAAGLGGLIGYAGRPKGISPMGMQGLGLSQGQVYGALKGTPVQRAEGGEIDGYAKGGGLHYLKSAEDGMADKIPATIDNKQPARLSGGEFVIPADVVSHLGNGNSEAGAKQLYAMMDRIRHARTGNKEQGKQINPAKFTPK